MRFTLSHDLILWHYFTLYGIMPYQKADTVLTVLFKFQMFQLNVKLSKLLECKTKCMGLKATLSPIISRSCTLYSAIASLSNLNDKYVIPFKTFKAWLVEAIESTEAPQLLQVLIKF